MKCILCAGDSSPFFIDPKSQAPYFHCGQCSLRFVDPNFRLPPEEEEHRYRQHNNVATDPRYQEFMRPVLERILKNPGAKVLDFGCGADSVLKHMLKDYEVSLYDPYFFSDTSVLHRTYDYIAATEVLEHLYNPGQEIERLRELLRPGGRLGVMTLFVTAETDFATWYYRRDPTHVCFYDRETLEQIRQRYGFSRVEILSDRLAEFHVCLESFTGSKPPK